MHTEQSLGQIQREWHGSLKSYASGFLISLLLTSAAFLLVLLKPLSGQALVYSLTTLALLQALCQLRFFLHVGQEAKPRWETLIFCFMLLILLIIVIGSLWIMHDLNDRVMANMTMDVPYD